MNTTSQIMEGVKESTGIDLSTLISSYMGAKGANKE